MKMTVIPKQYGQCPKCGTIAERVYDDMIYDFVCHCSKCKETWVGKFEDRYV